MYEELVKDLRYCVDGDKECAGCKRYGQMSCEVYLMEEAADAIEELQQTAEHYKGCADDWYKEACDYKALAPKWIPVTERLPIGGDDSGAICENVCLLMDDGTVSCGWMNGITKKVYYLNARDDFVIKAPITRVTHWMPLPEPPKEDEA